MTYEQLVGITGYLTLWTRCRCRYNRFCLHILVLVVSRGKKLKYLHTDHE